MINARYVLRIAACCLVGLAGCFSVAAQQKNSADSTFMQKVEQIGKSEVTSSIAKYQTERKEARQRMLLEAIRFEIQKAGLFLKQTVDTSDIVRDLAKSKKSYDIVIDGIFKNQGTHHTQRNLTVSDIILEQISISLETHRATLNSYYKTLSDSRFRIDSLSSDSVIYQFPTDSAAVIKYFKTMLSIMQEVAPLDSFITNAVSNIQELLQEMDMFAYKVHTARNEIEKLNTALSIHLGDREFPNLWEKPKNKRPFPEILSISRKKELLAIDFYVHDTKWRLLLFSLLFLCVSIFLISLKHRLKTEQLLQESNEGKLVVRFPLAAAFILTSSIFQFIFLDPPFIFSFILWTISAVCLSVLFYRYITGFWMRFWLIMVCAFLLAGVSNMLLQASRMERWCMLALQLFGTIYGLYILSSRHKHALKENKILYFVSIFTLIEFIAAGFNLFGRYNLSKTCMIVGYSGLIIAILFLWTVRLVNEGLSLATQVYQHPDKKLFYINFHKVGNKVPPVFYLFLIIGWGILMGRHFFIFRKIAGPLNNFLTTERTLGDYSFTINGIFIFVLILFCSLFLSRLISFFASEPDPTRGNTDRKGKVEAGSWLLLIRIIIISVGLFLAIAAAGIPLDRITLIIGALGVGIGLGLQALVNNLVSGLIIAFEKPVNVGDIIEVDGKSGTMKSIGFRSSVVVTADGSSLIIPNGDLLSQHLVNWTMSRNRKRLNLVIGVAYGTDLAKAEALLLTILKNEERIANNPPPVVLARDFASSSIELEIFFWMNDLRLGGIVKSAIIQQIDQQFKAAGIHIPVPQQEIWLHKPPTDTTNQ
ncbi:mechanosensitive ion channel domain-containing protein [Flavihumibacter sp. CACIAM 22H1]|uniref:mechanosensitive ion channel family protein n=1 Tax=Flavihumibacter sp. CACIAM 22H1 TaxID=1812911 RepID=UPI0007A7E9C5|nr:mechanosensitive ion channel domain-containing protein [Flavihumibacter sp. CACIAM 22H1]KYP16536.1 MAG: hypothetical protein A1D16_13785 [Flavihumibacter sp. CACIAM 22H1]